MTTALPTARAARDQLRRAGRRLTHLGGRITALPAAGVADRDLARLPTLLAELVGICEAAERAGADRDTCTACGQPVARGQLLCEECRTRTRGTR